MDILFIVIGLALVLAGADRLTEGAAAIAEKFRVSEFIIGLTIVAVGTSMPEFVVSISAALRGSSDMAIGNVVGSNIFNVFLILGLCATVSPLPLTRNNIRFDIPITLLASVLLFLAASDTLLHTGDADRIGRIEGVIMFILYIALIVYTIRSSNRERDDAENTVPRMKTPIAVFWTIAGLAALIGGSRLFIDGASALAHRMGISEAVIAITLVAGGTSLPELASSLASVIKGRKGMALGNVLGSNIFNILFILGGSAMISPLTLGDIGLVDMVMVLLSAVLPFIFAFTFRGHSINRIEGVMMLIIYGVYIRQLIS